METRTMDTGEGTVDKLWQLAHQPLYKAPSALQRLANEWNAAFVAAQLIGTLLILVFVPGTMFKAATFIAWWFLTFGTVTVLEGAIFVAANLLFGIMDINTVKSQAFVFASGDVMGVPYYEFLLWGFYILHVRRATAAVAAHSSKRLPLALLLATIFGVVFSAAPDHSTRLWAPAAAIGLALLFFHTAKDLANMGYMLAVGTLVEYTGVFNGLWMYPGEFPGGIPLWFVTVWAGVGLFAGRLLPRDNPGEAACHTPDILMVNSFNPRRRALSDVFLDNGMATLRAWLEQRGYAIEIEDRTGIGELDRISPRWLTRPLRRLSLRLLDARETGQPAPMAKLAFVALQNVLDIFHRVEAAAYIRRIVRKVREQHIAIVGIKVWYGNSFKWSKRLSAALKHACPETIVVAGGPHANLYNHDGAILRFSNFDLAVYSEGERALEAILECVRAGRTREERLRLIHVRKLNNVIWRDGDTVVVNAIERPQPDSKPVPQYAGQMDGKVLVHTLVDGLGCDYNRCTFCPHKNIYNGYRKRSVGAVVDEMEQMLKQGISVFRFASGDTPRCHAVALADEILRRGLNVGFSMFHRATKNAHRQFDKLVEEYRKLIRAGLKAVFMGLETGDDRTNQEVLGKNLSSDDVIWTIRAIQKARDEEHRTCDVALSMMHPVPSLPGITWDELFEKTLAVVTEVRPDSALVTPPCAFPGTDWFERPDHYGFAFGKGFVEQLMNYEYVLYKPTDMWDSGTFSLNGKSAPELLAETMRLRAAFEKANVPTDMGDETFLLLQATGEDPMRFKRETLADILSCNYEYSNSLYDTVNCRISMRALSNQFGADRQVDAQELDATAAMQPEAAAI